MIADALKATLPHATHVMVDLATIRYTDREKGVRYTYLTPASAQQALLCFDQGMEIDAWQTGFGFEIERAQVTRSNRDKARKEQKKRRKAEAQATGLPPIKRDGRLPNSTRPLTERQPQMNARLDATSDPLLRTTMRTDHTDGIRVGGELPPIGVLSNHKGRQRIFGLKQLKP